MIEVVGIVVELESDNQDVLIKLSNSFPVSKVNRADIKINIRHCAKINNFSRSIEYDKELQWLGTYSDSSGFKAFFLEEISKDILSMLEIDSTGESASIYYMEDIPYNIYEVIVPLWNIIFRRVIPLHNGLVVHASAIEWKGKGILFSAPSGTGKSTQANLWKQNMNARLINDDRPFVRVIKDKAFVYRTRWNTINCDALENFTPISAIIILEQAFENSIALLTLKEAVQRLMPRCFLPYYNNELMDMALDNFERLIKAAPIYLLRCRPDREAVELVYQCIK